MSKLKVNELDTESGTTITVAAGKTLAGTDIIGSTQIAANAVDTSEIAANAVTLVELEDGTQGDILYYGAAGAPTRLAAGTSGQFLQTQGSGQNPVYGSVTEYNDANILNDIATLALQQATQNNQSAYNLANAFIDQYEDETGVDVKTDVAYDATGEYFSTIAPGRTGSATVISASGNAQHSTNKAKFGTSSFQTYISGSAGQLSASPTNTAFGSGSWTIEYWINANAVNAWQEVIDLHGPSQFLDVYQNAATQTYPRVEGLVFIANTTAETYQPAAFTTGQWNHRAFVRNGSTDFKSYLNGTALGTTAAGGDAMPANVWNALTIGSGTQANWDDFRISDVARYTGNFSVPTARFETDSDTMFLLQSINQPNGNTTFIDSSPGAASATGNYTSTTETAAGTVSKMSIVVLYKNVSGTATLDTDLVAQVSANGGTNYTSAPLTPAGTFSTGILTAKSNDITISNTGTAPKYKISFANQSDGSKVTRVYGVALMY